MGVRLVFDAMSEPKLIAHVVAARPNYMKVAPLWGALGRYDVRQVLIHTGQHYDESLNGVFFRELHIPRPDVELEVGSVSHGEQTARALTGLERTFTDLGPDLVVVPGDVNSTLAAALAAVKLHVPVCHLEAGLRSFDPAMPEEHNRKLTDHVASLLLTTSADANENLAREGITDGVVLVGNTMIDTLFSFRESAEARAAWEEFGLERGAYVLVTLHRPSLVDDPVRLAETLDALGVLARTFDVIFAVHPRTQARIEAFGTTQPDAVHLVPPLAYETFLSLQLGSVAVVTDSGGVQEETTALGIPCFTLRANTERPVTTTVGTNTLLGLSPARIAEIPSLLQARAGGSAPPLWDGAAGPRAAAAVAAMLELPRSVAVERA
jgi:UDP-N-acetylglucosamine 2-epimerase (non-hydrolysing)